MGFFANQIHSASTPPRYLIVDGNFTVNADSYKAYNFTTPPEIKQYQVSGASTFLEQTQANPPNAPSIREGLAEQILVRAAEIGDTLGKEHAIICTPRTRRSSLFHFLSAIFNWAFSNSFYVGLS
jgi:hypothetical protein